MIRYLDDAYAIDTDAQVWARQVADALRGAIPEVNTTRVDDQATPDAGLLTRLRPASTRGWRSGSPVKYRVFWRLGCHASGGCRALILGGGGPSSACDRLTSLVGVKRRSASLRSGAPP